MESCSIDEFDKISDDDRASLHEALESQTISVAKAGIVATFTAKASVLAAANPKYGRFDPNVYPAEQFDIPTTLLSRFDLIFPIKDTMDEEHGQEHSEAHTPAARGCWRADRGDPGIRAGRAAPDRRRASEEGT